MSVTPKGYGDVITVLTDLPVLLRHERRARGVSLRDVAVQSGVSFSTVNRVERGLGCHSRNVVALLSWIDGGTVPLTLIHDGGKESP